MDIGVQPVVQLVFEVGALPFGIGFMAVVADVDRRAPVFGSIHWSMRSLRSANR
jgi:hypothetical protein